MLQEQERQGAGDGAAATAGAGVDGAHRYLEERVEEVGHCQKAELPAKGWLPLKVQVLEHLAGRGCLIRKRLFGDFKLWCTGGSGLTGSPFFGVSFRDGRGGSGVGADIIGND